MNTQFIKTLFCSTACVVATAGIVSAANVAVDVATPNVRVQVGTPAPPPPPQHIHRTVVERERVIVHEPDRRHDQGKHKGHYKNNKKQYKHDRHDRHDR